MAAPDFTAVYRRIDRAGRFRREVHELSLEHLAADSIRHEAEQSPDSIRVYAVASADFPVDVALSFSDWAHQLRAALDALLYQLAVADTGQNPPPGESLLQYPIEETQKEFDKVAARRLEHLSPALVDEIGYTQPYKIPTGTRGHGLWWLHEMAKIDRHRMAHEFAWNIRAVTLTGLAVKGAEVEHCHQLETYIHPGKATLLATINLAPGADPGPGLDIDIAPWPEIPRWHLDAVPSYRQYGLLDRMEGIEDIIRRTAQYFEDQDWQARGRQGSR